MKLYTIMYKICPYVYIYIQGVR